MEIWIILLVIAVLVAAYYFIPSFADTIRGWKTIVLGVVTGGVGFLQTFDLATIIEPENIGYALLGLGIAGVVLRVVTTGPVGKKDG
jgi:uncharacterized membrane protein